MAEKSVLSLLVEQNRRHELEHIFKRLSGQLLLNPKLIFLCEKNLVKNLCSDIDVLHFSQVCRSWRKHCTSNNVFDYHEKQLLLKNELILNSEELDAEYAFLEEKFGSIDNIEFYFYIKRRVNAAIYKTNVFNHRLTHCYQEKGELFL